MLWSPVICNCRYDDMGPLRNADLSDDAAKAAEDLLGQGYDLVASSDAEKVRNNSIET